MTASNRHFHCRGRHFRAVSGIAQAAPIAPLPAAVTTDTGNLTPVYYYGHHYRTTRTITIITAITITIIITTSDRAPRTWGPAQPTAAGNAA